MKNHLRDQENRLARTRRARAETAPPPGHTWKKWEIHHITLHICWRTTRARPSNARQSILLITEMIFDYLVAIVAPKAEKIALLKIWKFPEKIQKIWNFSKFFEIFKIFENFFWFWWISNWCLFMVFKAIIMIKESKIISVIRRID